MKRDRILALLSQSKVKVMDDRGFKRTACKVLSSSNFFSWNSSVMSNGIVYSEVEDTKGQWMGRIVREVGKHGYHRDKGQLMAPRRLAMDLCS